MVQKIVLRVRSAVRFPSTIRFALPFPLTPWNCFSLRSLQNLRKSWKRWQTFEAEKFAQILSHLWLSFLFRAFRPWKSCVSLLLLCCERCLQIYFLALPFNNLAPCDVPSFGQLVPANGLEQVTKTQDGLGLVRLQLVHGLVRAVPVFGSDGPFGERGSSMCL